MLKEIRILLVEYLLLLALLFACFYTFSILGVGLSGNRLDGMMIGAYTGVVIAVILFYYMRSSFFLKVSLLHGTINTVVTVLLYLAYTRLIMQFFYESYGLTYMFIDFLFPIIFLLNKRLLDRIFKNYGEEKREKLPLKLE